MNDFVVNSKCIEDQVCELAGQYQRFIVISKEVYRIKAVNIPLAFKPDAG